MPHNDVKLHAVTKGGWGGGGKGEDLLVRNESIFSTYTLKNDYIIQVRVVFEFFFRRFCMT